jgi:glycosyltransferase involved in cell wall biosynthesis
MSDHLRPEHAGSGATAYAAGTTVPVKVSIVIPCLNEEMNIEQCVTSALRVLEAHAIDGEVIVPDNASEDRSAELAAAAGATVVHEPRRLGERLPRGVCCRPRRLHRHDRRGPHVRLRRDPDFVRQLDEGAELVMGNGMKNIEPGAMSGEGC